MVFFVIGSGGLSITTMVTTRGRFVARHVAYRVHFMGQVLSMVVFLYRVVPPSRLTVNRFSRRGGQVRLLQVSRGRRFLSASGQSGESHGVTLTNLIRGNRIGRQLQFPSLVYQCTNDSGS